MSFFDSEVVRAEMTEVGQLQQEVYTSMFSFYSMTKEDKIKHIDLLSRLLEKQKVLYTRLSLSDDPEAQKLKQRNPLPTIMNTTDELTISTPPYGSNRMTVHTICTVT